MAGQESGVNLMWGNRQGWAIAAVLAVLIGIGVWQLIGVNRLTPTTKLLIQHQSERLTPEVPPATVVASDVPGDAGALYCQAIAEVAREPRRYEPLETTDDALAVERTPAGGRVLHAAPLTGDRVLAADPAADVGYRAATDDLNALLLLANAFSRSALLRLDADPPAARRTLEAQFALGAKLFAERVRYAEADTGLAIMRDAVAGLRSLAEKQHDAARVALLNTFDRSAAAMADGRLRPVWEAVGAIDPATIATHAGDVYALAGRQTVERMWRVEAILALGRHRFSVERLADQLIVPRRLRELAAGETDPLILAAIDAAQQLTVEQFRTLR